jgi:hypothetical protein
VANLQKLTLKVLRPQEVGDDSIVIFCELVLDL